jgi:glycerol-3-phosphate acyltransferase PlsY
MPVLEVLAPLLAILRHNYSNFLAERDENGKLHFHGGAGGAIALGGAIGFIPARFSVIFEVALIMFFCQGKVKMS